MGRQRTVILTPLSGLRRLLPLLVLALGLFATPEASAQGLNGKYRNFPAQGVKFRNLRDFSDVPVNDRLKPTGLVCQGESEKVAAVKNTAGKAAKYKPKLYVFWDEAVAPLSGGDEETRKKAKVRRPVDYATTFQEFDFDDVEPEIEDFKSSKKIEGQRHTYRITRGSIEVVVDIYVFQVDRAKLVFCWDYPGDRKTGKKWMGAVEKSMKTLRDLRGDDDEEELAPVNSESSYEDLHAWHEREVKATPGWKLEETKSKNYLIKTNTDNKKNIRAVKKRLEASRKLFGKDFPPPKPITSVSVVRICATRKEFSKYGQTRPGVAGYFNPGSEELVLFFEDGKIEETFGVMTHEAFHQYCHFLFDRSAAHRWFDEGHGDYYGAWILRGSRLIREDDMEGGLSRIPHLKELIEEGQLKKVSKHIRFDHKSWQSQGPRNISNYCQSFGIISYLRRGADRDVPRRLWNEDYATIIPNYIAELSKGFSEAYAEIVEEATGELETLEEEDEPDEEKIELLTKVIARPFDYFVDADRRQQIWDNAMAASWGKIDENQFEEDWLKWMDSEL